MKNTFKEFYNGPNLTNGLKKAFAVGKEIIKKCDKCGAALPNYKGRNPSYCYNCGDIVNWKDLRVADKQTYNDTIKLKGVSQAMVNALKDERKYKIENKRFCPKCKSEIPKYVGRYGSCWHCGTKLTFKNGK